MLSVDGRLREILPPSPTLPPFNPHLFIYSSIHPPTHSFSPPPICVSVESDTWSPIPQSRTPPPPHPHPSFTTHTVAKDMSSTFMFFYINPHANAEKWRRWILFVTMWQVREGGQRQKRSLRFSFFHLPPIIRHPVILTLKLLFKLMLTPTRSTDVFFCLLSIWIHAWSKAFCTVTVKPVEEFYVLNIYFHIWKTCL